MLHKERRQACRTANDHRQAQNPSTAKVTERWPQENVCWKFTSAGQKEIENFIATCNKTYVCVCVCVLMAICFIGLLSLHDRKNVFGEKCQVRWKSREKLFAKLTPPKVIKMLSLSHSLTHSLSLT